MSFKCQVCNVTSQPREKAVRVTSKQRRVRYPLREDAYSFKNAIGIKMFKDDRGGEGWQIAEEKLVHLGCAQRVEVVSINELPPDDVVISI